MTLSLINGPHDSNANVPATFSSISDLPQVERHRILVEWNRTERDFPQDKCLHQLFEEQVERTPDVVSVVFEGQSLTYRELNTRANQLSHHLRSLGVGPDALVGVYMERSLEMIIALLGSLKAGGAYVPIDPNDPPERVAFMIADAGASVLLTQGRLVANLPSHSAHVLVVDEHGDKISHEKKAKCCDGTTSENLAYMIYTSGSTGQPKGALNTHRGICNRLLWMQEQYRLGSADVVLQKTPFSFDVSVWEFFWPLITGARLVLAKPGGHKDAAYLAQLICDHRITTLHFVPPMLGVFLKEPRIKDCRSLRHVFCSGEALPYDLQEKFFHLLDAQLYNLYGPTEAAVDATHWTCRPDSELRIVPIGRPVANTQCYILDPRLQPVPIGAVGELYLGGVQVGRGYHKRPELTAERFIRDPFSVIPEARLYKTGDLARYLPDGIIEFQGRLDDQIKIRGIRIELGEIEAACRHHPGIDQAAVLAQECASGDKILVCYFVPHPLRAGSLRQMRQVTGTASVTEHVWSGPTLLWEDLRSYLKVKLPDYMIPSRFVVLESFPLTSSGKVDRKALKKLDGAQLTVSTDHVPPQNELEYKLVDIWQSVFRRDRVGNKDNFFELGGHSLLAMAICAQVTRRLNIEVPLRWVFEHPTIEKLAHQIESLGKHSQNIRPLVPADRQHLMPMSFAQQRIWLLHQTLPDPATYNEPIAFRLTGRVDRQRVRCALQKIVERHEVLRTALVQLGESLVQKVTGAQEFPLPWVDVDLQAVPPGQKQSASEARLRAEARRPFDLTLAPLWRCTCINLTEEELVLLFTFHHSIVDEWSLRLFLQELEGFYASITQTGPDWMPELPVQYAEFALRQRQRLTGDLLAQQRHYWKEQLQDLPPVLTLPADMARPLQLSGRGAIHKFRLPGLVVKGLRELAREEKTTLFTVLLAAFAVWLHRYTGQTDVVVGTPVANREEPDVQAMIGFFLNTLPIRVRLEGCPGFRRVLRQLRELLLGAFSHADLPFEQIVEMVVKERDPGHQPLCQVMFVLLEEGLPPFRLGQAQAEPLPVETCTSKNDLTLSIEATGEIWTCQFEYATDLFTAASVARMGCHLTELLRSITEEPEKSISQLNLMPAQERHQVLVEWNKTQRDYPREQCIDELFEEQVRQRPDAVALELGEERITYGELNRRADHIAWHLCALGVKPGDVVGISVERSFERIIGLLGILKTGAAYWAVEENLPEERVRFLVGDARPKVILKSKKMAQTHNGTPTAAVEDLLAARPAKEVCLRSIRSEDPAYVSYTSGSTGQPKGVVVPHRGVVRLVKGADYVSLNSEETLLHMSPLSFDASTFELWGALLNGGRVVLLPPGQPSLAEIGAVIRHHGVSTLWLTAALFHLIVDEQLDDLKSLRQLLAGGDVLCPQRVAKTRRALPGCRLINGYGPTENTTFTCCFPVGDEQEFTPTVPIGRPIANTRVYILDAHEQPVPVGVAGELYAGGDGVACGYLHQPQLTAERFIPDPFSSVAGARLYRTGDRVRWRPDGNIEFLGRLDNQVKIRGFRVELGEIEGVLRSCPRVREAVVVRREDLPADNPLVGYVVLAKGAHLSSEAMRCQLRERLPEYMVPYAFIVLDQLPLLPNGKVDRQRLPMSEGNAAATSARLSQPKDLLELKLIQIWQRLFQREDIDLQDNFFALGGHSLLAARLAVEIEKLLGHKVPIATFFHSPTVELLARRLTDENWAPPWSSLVPLQPQGSKPPFFLVHGWGGSVYGQGQLGLARRFSSDQPVYGIQAVGLDGKAPRHTTVEAMAAHYVQEICSFQPTGPYYLGGYSMGGLIAFEVAQQLYRHGHRVALLALLDSAPIGPLPWFLYGLRMSSYIPRRFWFHFRHWWELPPRERLSYFRGRWAALRYWLVRNRSQPSPVTAPPQVDSQPPQVPGFDDYYHAVASVYRPQRYPGAINVFVSDDADCTWRRYWRYLACGGASFHPVPGHHFQILTPDYVPVLANSLTTVLYQAQERERATHLSNR